MSQWSFALAMLLVPLARPVFRFVLRCLTWVAWRLPWSPSARVALFRDDRW